VLGIVPEMLNAVYCPTKAFLIAFSCSLHKDFAGKNLRVYETVRHNLIPKLALPIPAARALATAARGPKASLGKCEEENHAA
jgi:hypothetical protein